MSQKERKGRASNIELLRILSLLGVIVLHYNNTGIGKALLYVKHGTLNYYILMLLESVFICAVNVFILISGYFMSQKNKINIIKPIQLIIQVIVFSLISYCFQIKTGNDIFSIKGILSHMVPNNYFVILYITVYILSPYLNCLIHQINDKKKFIIISFMLFSIYPTIVDLFTVLTKREWMGLSSIGMYGSQEGYTIVNFIMMYMIGAVIRNIEDKIKYNQCLYCMAFAIIAILNLLWGIYDTKTAWEYCNPLVVLEAVIIFILFKQIKMKSNSTINTAAKAAFSVFLLHTLFLPYIRIEKYVNAKLIVLIMHVFVSAVIIYSICTLVYIIYEKMTNPIFKKMDKKLNGMGL